MEQIVPGVMHWTRRHPRIGREVHSYHLVPERTLLDPMEPEEGFGALDPAPRHVALTNRHHYRDAAIAARELGCEVRAPEPGMHEFEGEQQVLPYRYGSVLPGGILALEIGGLCPDEAALFVPREGGILALADCAMRELNGPLQFFPDELLGEDPERVKREVRAACDTLLELDFSHVLLAHGAPILGGGKEALARFVGR